MPEIRKKLDRNLVKKIRKLVERASKSSITNDINYFDTVEEIAENFPYKLVEQLWQLVNGPVYDGDIISKADRGRLFDMGIAIRVCKDGKQGYTGSKYIGYSILKELDELDYGD